MLKRLVIHRFRGIREGVLDDLGKINLLIGPNNSGKTAILELLYLGGVSGRPCTLAMEEVEPSAFEATTLGTYDFLGEEPMPRLRLRHGQPKYWQESPAVITEDASLVITPGHGSEGFPLREFSLSAPPDEPGKRSEAFFQKDIERISMVRLEQQERLPPDIIPLLFDEQGIQSENSTLHYLWEPSWVHKWDQEKPMDNFSVWAVTGKMPAAERVLFFDFHTVNHHFNTQFSQWAKNAVPDLYEKIARRLSSVFPDLQGANEETDDSPGRQKGESGYIRFPGKTRLPIDQFGDGARHAFKVLASLNALVEQVDDAHPGLVLWEDPELFMHPESLNRLLEELLRLVREKPIQMFISSQSIEMVAFLTHHFQEQFSDLQSDYRVIRLDLEDGRLAAARYHYENVLAWLEEGMDLRFWNVAGLPISYRYRIKDQSLVEEI